VCCDLTLSSPLQILRGFQAFSLLEDWQIHLLFCQGVHHIFGGDPLKLRDVSGEFLGFGYYQVLC